MSSKFTGAATAAGKWTTLCKVLLWTEVYLLLRNRSGRSNHTVHKSKGKKEAQAVYGNWLFFPLHNLIRHLLLLKGRVSGVERRFEAVSWILLKEKKHLFIWQVGTPKRDNKVSPTHPEILGMRSLQRERRFRHILLYHIYGIKCKVEKKT